MRSQAVTPPAILSEMKDSNVVLRMALDDTIHISKGTTCRPDRKAKRVAARLASGWKKVKRSKRDDLEQGKDSDFIAL